MHEHLSLHCPLLCEILREFLIERTKRDKRFSINSDNCRTCRYRLNALVEPRHLLMSVANVVIISETSKLFCEKVMKKVVFYVCLRQQKRRQQPFTALYFTCTHVTLSPSCTCISFAKANECLHNPHAKCSKTDRQRKRIS